MKLSFKPRHLKRYKDIFLLLVKYGRADVAEELGAEERKEILGEHDLPREELRQVRPEELADDLERMGPTFVKIGQLLSSRADLLPDAYLKALARLQDKVKPFSFQEVEKIIETELNVRLSKAFSSFRQEPLAAASLGQVHAAALRDGRSVAVKIQRPGIRQQIEDDFEVLQELAGFLDDHTRIGRRYRFTKMLDEFRTTLDRELDYRCEAANLTMLANNLREFARIRVPSPISDYNTSRVLVMDFVYGTKITMLSPLVRLDIDGQALADELFKAYLKQVLVDGLFHADPHPGNVFLTDDNKIALLDLGMIGRVTSGMQEQLLKLLLALSEGNSETTLQIILEISEQRERFDEPEFRRKIGELIVQQRDATLEQMDLGKTLLKTTRASADTGLYVPSELTMLGKTLLQLDQIGRILAPDFDPNAAVRRHVSDILSSRAWRNLSPSNFLTPLLEAKDFVSALPRRLNRILDTVGNSDFHVKIRTQDTEHLMGGFQKIANRITTGLILSALIVGAALLMQINTPFTILGYPGLAMICFMFAGGGGLWLVLSIVFKDYRDRKRLRHRRGH